MSSTKSLLFCFDFDLTLVDGHFHKELSDKGVIPGNVSHEAVQDLLSRFNILNQNELLKTFNLILNNHHHIAITTWSEYPEVIIPTLRKLGLTEDQIHGVHIESGLPDDSRLRKSSHIAKAKAHFNIENNEDIILVDDDEKNIEKALNEGQVGILVDSAKTSTQYLQSVQDIVAMTAKQNVLQICKMIILADKDIINDTDREVISINGMPFYKSSGANSCYSKTWLPFLGVNEDPNHFLGKGWFIKPDRADLPKEVIEKMEILFPSYGPYTAGKDLQLRFLNLAGILISSCLGGGLWDEERGKKLKQFLMKRYPGFYCQAPIFALLPSELSSATPEQSNQWLCEKAYVENYKQLADQYPQTLTGLIHKLNSPHIAPPKPQVHQQLPTAQTGSHQGFKRVAISAVKSSIFACIPAVILWQFAVLSLMPVIAIGVILAITHYAFFENLRIKVNATKATLTTLSKQAQQQWLQGNGTAYELGYQSKAWLPYLQSYAKPAAYLKPCAYQLGLEDALEGKNQRKLIAN